MWVRVVEAVILLLLLAMGLCVQRSVGDVRTFCGFPFIFWGPVMVSIYVVCTWGGVPSGVWVHTWLSGPVCLNRAIFVWAISSPGMCLLMISGGVLISQKSGIIFMLWEPHGSGQVKFGARCLGIKPVLAGVGWKVQVVVPPSLIIGFQWWWDGSLHCVLPFSTHSVAA